MIRVLSAFKAFRFRNLVILAIAQFSTAYFLGSRNVEIFENPSLWILAIATSFIAAAGYIINDYYDIKIDLVNHPDKVVIGKELPRRQAIILHTLFNAIGIALGVWVSLKVGAVNLVSAFFLWWYSNYLKKIAFVGNLVIGILTGVSIALVGILFPSNMESIAVFAFFAGAISIIREIIKDIEDQVGDKKFGYKTLPVVLGIRKTKNLLSVLIILFSLSYIVMSYLQFRSSWMIFAIVLVPFLLVLMVRLYRADTKQDFVWLSGYCKIIMLVGIGLMTIV